MTEECIVVEHRRSQRIPFSVPVFIKSLDPKLNYAVRCVLLDISRHGCQVSAPRPFTNGTWLSLQLLSSNRLTAVRVIRSIPVEPDINTWKVGLELYRPGKILGVHL